MCGFVGIVDLRETREVDKELLIKMNDSQYHRGPDESGIHLSPGVGLGHRRLSIIDLKSGQQPLYNEDNSVVIVFNGEIYNHHELRNELKKRGHTFRTNCDTEVIVHAWEEWKEGCVSRFNGMFSFAIWDSNNNEVFLGRDRLGIKPLYYALLPNEQLIFGTELKALLVHPGLNKEIELRSVEEYFAFGYVPDPGTILKGVYKLQPAHTIRCSRGANAVVQKEYWDVSFSKTNRISFEDAKQELIDRLKSSVNLRLMSEVPLGAFLSGGVDSSAVVAMMAEVSKSAVNTCSISFGEPEYNEAEYALAVAERYGTNHHVDNVSSDDYDLVETLARCYDEPFADSSALPTYRVCELARRNVTVALSGDGGDESFAGYRRYKWHANEELVRSRISQSIRGPLFGLLGTVYPKLDWAPRMLRAKTTFQALAMDSIAGFLDSVSVVSDSSRKAMFGREFKKALNGYQAVDVLRGHASKSDAEDPVSLVQYLDIKTYLPGDILTKVDRASMAHSLEVRVPLLDHTFTEWVAGLPASWKLRGGEGKHIFKDSLRSYLSDDVLFRQKKGFAVPVATWFRGALSDRIHDLPKSSHIAQSGLFNSAVIDKMIVHHQNGLKDHSATIWSLLMFEASLRNMDLSISV